MIRNFKLVRVETKYCNYLRKYDNKVCYNAGIKELRPFVGILFKVNDLEYYAPLSSPKARHSNLKNTIDLIKINDGKYGVINFNNMIPVNYNNYEIIDLNKKTSSIDENKRINLLKSQLKWLNNNYKLVTSKAIRLYDMYKVDKLPKNVKDRCCNFLLLEKKCVDYSNSVND